MLNEKLKEDRKGGYPSRAGLVELIQAAPSIPLLPISTPWPTFCSLRRLLRLSHRRLPTPATPVNPSLTQNECKTFPNATMINAVELRRPTRRQSNTSQESIRQHEYFSSDQAYLLPTNLGTSISEWKGVPEKDFYMFYGELLFALSKPVDVVDLSRKTRFVELILREGVPLYGLATVFVLKRSMMQ